MLLGKIGNGCPVSDSHFFVWRDCYKRDIE